MSKLAQFWMVKQEPTAYAWSALVADGRTAWTGVRNFQARLNLRAMRKGDRVFYYHSVEGKEVVGIAKVVAEAYRDPTATEGEWDCVDIAPIKALKRPVTLQEMKSNAKLRELKLIRQSRLSVLPLTPAEYEEILALSAAPAP